MTDRGRARKVSVENTAQAYLELLQAVGVKYLFGNAGTDFAPIIDAFAKFAAEGKNSLQPVTVPHEFCAVSMAHGYAMVTGEPQVVMVHTTVGTANALGALINASRSSVPLILTAGRTPITEQGLPGSRDLLIHWAQESFDQGGMVREYVKWDYELRNFAQLETVVRRAFTLAATDPKGPVYLTLPREVLAESQREFSFTDGASSSALAPAVPGAEKIEQAAALLAQARSPVIITRTLGRNPKAVSALVQLAEAFALPVIEFPFPQYVNFPTDHPLHQGFNPGPRVAVADAVLVVDCDVPWLPSVHKANPDASVIHLGLDPLRSRYPIWGFPVDLAMAGDSAEALPLLTRALEKLRHGRDSAIHQRFSRLSGEHKEQREQWRREALSQGEGAVIKFEWLSHCLNELLGPDAIVVNEYDLSLRHFNPRGPGSFFGISPSGCLGWGVGAALGAKLGAPGKLVVAVVGDGSYIFSVPSACHLVSAMYQLPILVVICNNGGWGSPRLATRGVHPQGWAVRTENFPFCRFTVQPAYEMLVQAYGGHGRTVSDPKKLSPVLAEAVKVVQEEKRQAVVNVVCG